MRKLLVLTTLAFVASSFNLLLAQYIPFTSSFNYENGKYWVMKKFYSFTQDNENNLTLHPKEVTFKHVSNDNSQNKKTLKKGELSAQNDSTKFQMELTESEYDQPIFLKYTGYLHQELVNSLKKGDTLKNLFIDTLNLRDFVQKRGQNYIVSFPILMKNCIVREVIFSEKNSGLQGTNTGEKPSYIFEATVCFENCFFTNFITFEKATFNKSLALIDVGTWENLAFKNCTVKGELFIQDNTESFFYEDELLSKSNPDTYITNALDHFYDAQSIKFENSQFLSDAFIQKQSYYLPFTFSKCTFSRNTHFACFRSDYSKSIFKTSKEFLHPHQRNNNYFNTLVHVQLSDCNFNGTVNLENTVLESTTFGQPTFRDSVILFNMAFSDTVIFNNPRFLNTKGENAIVVNPEYFKFKYLGCSNYSAKQIYLPFINTDSTNNPELFRQAYNDFYLNLQQEVKYLFEKKEEVKNELVARFDNERNSYETKYHWQANNFGLFMLNSSLEMIVNHGYHGEANVAITAFSVMIFFSLLYLIFFPAQVEQYLKTKDATTESPVVTAGKRTFFLRLQDIAYSFAKCFWVSFNIFMTPKFTNSFFKIDKRLFWLFVLEWIIGLFVIVLFLIYIASKYSFVKALVGL